MSKSIKTKGMINVIILENQLVLITLHIFFVWIKQKGKYNLSVELEAATLLGIMTIDRLVTCCCCHTIVSWPAACVRR